VKYVAMLLRFARVVAPLIEICHAVAFPSESGFAEAGRGGASGLSTLM